MSIYVCVRFLAATHIRSQVFNVKEPFTQEEERAIEAQYPWLVESNECNPSG